MRGSRVYIPKTLQTEILKELHSRHFGVVKMKSLARSHCRWPAIDRDIENLHEIVQIVISIRIISQKWKYMYGRRHRRQCNVTLRGHFWGQCSYSYDDAVSRDRRIPRRHAQFIHN